MKVTAINTSPRSNWNTAILVKEAAKGAEAAGATVEYFDLYKLDKFMGCMSCFACKREPNEGVCVFKDGLQPVLQSIREADAVIIGTPIYISNPSAGFHALYERQAFQNVTYQKERPKYNKWNKPTLFIVTSNLPEKTYPKWGYDQMVERYRRTLASSIGPTEVFICGNTLQVDDYSKYNWTLFDVEIKKDRRENRFPQDKARVFELGKGLLEKQ